MTLGKRARGFTLIELLTTFALLAVLLVLAAPNFIAFQRNAELTSNANAFVAALSAARAEAMKRQLSTFVVPVSGEDWATGWVVFVDVDSDLARGAGDIEVSQQPAIPGTLSVVVSADANAFNDTATSRKYVMYNGSGFMRQTGGGFQAGALELESVTGAKRRIIAEPAGRLRVCNPDADTGCDAATL